MRIVFEFGRKPLRSLVPGRGTLRPSHRIYAMLFTQATLDGIANGNVTVAFRRWRRPTVRAGGTLMTAVGVLAIDAVENITMSDITPGDARAAGYRNGKALEAELAKRREGSLYRITFHLEGADPRIALRSTSRLSAKEVADIHDQLARWDRASRGGAWTRSYLALIDRKPGVRAPAWRTRSERTLRDSRPTSVSSRRSG